jgi:hypothetical protein
VKRGCINILSCLPQDELVCLPHNELVCLHHDKLVYLVGVEKTKQ